MIKASLYKLIICCLLLILCADRSIAVDQNPVQLKSSEVAKIAVDAGQGGHNLGAPGCMKGVYSKDINLSIARKLSQKIRKKLGIDVIMTRTSDTFVTLEERIHLANSNQADLFISIHTNAAKDKRAHGIETYYLNFALGADSPVEGSQNDSDSINNTVDFQTILFSLLQNSKIYESERLARHVQKSLYFQIKSKYSSVTNRGTKQAPFYVLLGANMPAVLIATSFISNPTECKRLLSEEYQNDLCDGIVNGVQSFIAESHMTKK